MSWLARSIVNSLKLDHEDDDNDNNHGESSSNINKPANHLHIKSQSSSSSEGDEIQQQSRGVKDDFSELTNTLTRQFWGVASFLAPPPSDLPDRSQPSDQMNDDASGSTIRSDFAEIGGKLKTGISKLSSNITAVSEISKIASNFLQFGSAEEAVGVTEEVVAFAKNIALHPETWLDFPLPHDQDDDDDVDDFDMSHAQHEHALAVERLAPELTAIRIEICPTYMSEGCFWKIYFVLLHPRLDKHEAILLSTPQIMKSRAMLTHELRTRVKENPESERSAEIAVYSNETASSLHDEHLSVPSVAQFELPLKTDVAENLTNSGEDSHLDTQKHPNTEVSITDKSIIHEKPPKVWDEKYEDDGDDWLKEETTEEVGGTNETTIPIGNDEDVSFSDLEEDDDEDVNLGKKKVAYGSDSSTKESNDWLHVDDIDVM